MLHSFGSPSRHANWRLSYALTRLNLSSWLAIQYKTLQADLASIEKELFTPNSLAPWFTADVKLGSLAIHLELASCFAAGPHVYHLPTGSRVSTGGNACA